jgi:hypothetical protein
MRVAFWNMQWAVQFAEGELARLDLREGDGVEMVIELPRILLFRHPGSDCTIHRNSDNSQREHPWKIVWTRSEKALLHTRFSAVQVDYVLDRKEGCLELELPDTESLPWPVYRQVCASYTRRVEMSKDYLLRHIALGREPRMPEYVRRDLPAIVRNFARAGKAEDALARLGSEGEDFLTVSRAVTSLARECR